MTNYNFKNFFSERYPVIHNNEYVSNAYFLIKKSMLKKSQLEFINAFPMNETKMQQIQSLIENESKKPIITEFIPQFISKDNEYNILITELDGGYKGYSDWLNKIYPAIQEEYYNFIKSLKYKICIVNNDQVSPLSIYNNDNEFVGIVLSVRVKDLDIPNAQDYNEYLDNLKAKKEAKKLAKQNSKKCLYIKNNKAIVKNKELICIADITNDEAYKNLYIEKCIQEDKDAEVYIDLGIVCVYVRTIQASCNKDKNVDYDYYLGYLKDKNITLEMVITDIRNKRINNQFVNVSDIKLIELSGASKQEVQELINYRQEWYDRKAEENQKKRLEQEQKDKEYVDTKNKIVKDLVLAAEQAILNKQEVKNQEVTVYKSKYNGNSLSLILYMMKQYNINVPLKTQGWINQALTSIQYNEKWEEYSYKYYKTSSNSTVFSKYLNMLIKAIQEKYVEIVTV